MARVELAKDIVFDEYAWTTRPWWIYVALKIYIRTWSKVYLSCSVSHIISIDWIFTTVWSAMCHWRRELYSSCNTMIQLYCLDRLCEMLYLGYLSENAIGAAQPKPQCERIWHRVKKSGTCGLVCGWIHVRYAFLRNKPGMHMNVAYTATNGNIYVHLCLKPVNYSTDVL